MNDGDALVLVRHAKDFSQNARHVVVDDAFRKHEAEARIARQSLEAVASLRTALDQVSALQPPLAAVANLQGPMEKLSALRDPLERVGALAEPMARRGMRSQLTISPNGWFIRTPSK